MRAEYGFVKAAFREMYIANIYCLGNDKNGDEMTTFVIAL